MLEDNRKTSQNLTNQEEAKQVKGYFPTRFAWSKIYRLAEIERIVSQTTFLDSALDEDTEYTEVWMTPDEDTSSQVGNKFPIFCLKYSTKSCLNILSNLAENTVFISLVVQCSMSSADHFHY